MIRNVMTIILFFTVFAPLLSGHGINVAVQKKYPFIMVHASYHGGKALSDARVTVVFGEGKKEFQKGDTDRNGNFCFYPDKPGTWVITADDLRGHRKKAEMILGGDFFSPSPAPPPVPAPGETPGAKGKTVKEPGPGKPAKPQKEEKQPPSPFSTGEWCCYMLKIVLGVILILGITFIVHRWSKRQVPSSKK